MTNPETIRALPTCITGSVMPGTNTVVVVCIEKPKMFIAASTSRGDISRVLVVIVTSSTASTTTMEL
jgi:hypothetical protein